MQFLINILSGNIALYLLVLLSIIWILRLLVSKMPENDFKKKLSNINSFLRRNHILLSKIFLGCSLLHGILSSFSLLSPNFGTVGLVIGIGLFMTFKYKKILKRKWIVAHRILTIMIILITILHLIEVNGFVGPEKIWQHTKQQFTTEPLEESDTSTTYKDGTYEGVAAGYQPGLKVSVEIENGKIKDIKIIDHNEVGRKFYMPAFEVIPQEIIKKQSTQVDAVTGATYSSKGIMKAVENALSNAK